MLSKLIRIGFNYSALRYAVLVIALFKSLMIAEGLGPVILGSYSLLILVIEYLNYINLGVFNSMTRDVSVNFNKDQTTLLNQTDITGNALSFSLISLIILMIVMFVSYFYSFSFIPEEIYQYYPLLFVLIFTYQLKQFILRYLRLNENYMLIGWAEFISQSINFAGVYLFIDDYLLDAVMVSILISNLSLVLICFANSCGIRLSFNFMIMRNLVKDGIPMLVHSLFLFFLMAIDRFMIIYLYTDRKALGLYQLGFILALGCFKAFESITFLFQPKWFEHFHGNNQNEKLKLKSLKDQTTFLEVGTVCLSILGIAIVPFFIQNFLPDYDTSIKISQLLIISFVFNGLTFFVNIYLMSNSKEYSMLPSIFISLVIATILNYFFYDLGYGLYGFAFTKVIAFLLYGIMIYLTLYLLSSQGKINNLLEIYSRIILLFVPTVIIIYEELSLMYMLALFILLYSKIIFSIYKKIR